MSVLLIDCAGALLIMIFFLYMVLSLTLMMLLNTGLGHLTATHSGLMAGHWRYASSLALRVIGADVEIINLSVYLNIYVSVVRLLTLLNLLPISIISLMSIVSLVLPGVILI